MKICHVVLPAGPYHGQTQAESESGLEIHAPAVSGEIGNNEPRGSNLSNNLIIYTVNVLYAIHNYRVIARAHDPDFKAFFVCRHERWVKPHCDKAFVGLCSFSSEFVSLNVAVRQDLVLA